MEKGNINIQINLNMKEIGMRIDSMDLELKHGKMGPNLKVFSNMELKKGMGNSYGKMVQAIKDNLIII